MTKLRFAVFGCGFWSQYQIPAWLGFPEVELVAVCDRDPRKAEATARKFGAASYTDPAELLAREHLDFVDIITDADTHVPLVRMAAERGLTIICQKPLAPDLHSAAELVAFCESRSVPLFVHENFRWQAPMRRLKGLLESGVIGPVFRANIDFRSAFPVFDNQPFLKEQEQFILSDVGAHILDIVRFLLGEVTSLYCTTKSVTPGIKGEDVADVVLEMKSGAHCMAGMSYASILERDVFPETLILLEGHKGSLYLGPDYSIKVTTRKGTIGKVVPPEHYPWANPDYELLHASMVDIHKNFIDGLTLRDTVETTGSDNLKTLELVFAAYESARSGKSISVEQIYSLI